MDKDMEQTLTHILYNTTHLETVKYLIEITKQDNSETFYTRFTNSRFELDIYDYLFSLGIDATAIVERCIRNINTEVQSGLFNLLRYLKGKGVKIDLSSVILFNIRFQNIENLQFLYENNGSVDGSLLPFIENVAGTDLFIKFHDRMLKNNFNEILKNNSDQIGIFKCIVKN